MTPARQGAQNFARVGPPAMGSSHGSLITQPAQNFARFGPPTMGPSHGPFTTQLAQRTEFVQSLRQRTSEE